MKFSDDPDWWHERLVLYPAYGDDIAILTADNDVYVESRGLSRADGPIKSLTGLPRAVGPVKRVCVVAPPS